MKFEIAFIQKKVSPYGGGEMFALRFIREMKKLGYLITLLANSIDPSIEEDFKFIRIPIWKPFSFLKILSFAKFCSKAAHGSSFSLIISNERTFYQDIYFAGEGCHQSWLRQRYRQTTRLKKWLIRINPLHWTILYLEKLCLSNSRLKTVIAFSERTKKELMEEHGLSKDKIKVVYHGAPASSSTDVDRDTLRKDMGISGNDLVILFIGSGFERKGLKFLIEAVSCLEKNNIHLFVVGKGRTGAYKKQVKNLKLEGKVHFFGRNPNTFFFYNIADIFVLPTIYEPFGLVVLEAMSYKVPVVVSQYAGASELIKDGENGLIIKNPFDPRSIADCIRLLQNTDVRNKIAHNGFELGQKYTLENNTREILDAIEDSIQSRVRQT